MIPDPQDEFSSDAGVGAPLDTEAPERGRPRFDWRLRSRSLRLGDRTRLMAIVNLTPDSFSGDGLYNSNLTSLTSAENLLKSTKSSSFPTSPDTRSLTKLAVAAAVEAFDSGADILDLGAESTRPGATPISPAEEQSRLLPVLEGILHARPGAILSVDTYHADTARLAARCGAEIINDVSGLGWDPAMAAAAAQSGCGLVLMHTRGRPREWLAQGPMTRDEVVPSVFSGLCEALAIAESAGISTERIVLDPGFGFGKRGAENIALLAGLGRLRELDRPLLIGLSRKGFLGETVSSVQPPGLPIAESRRIATVAANVAAVIAGAHILRVHDLQAAREAVAVADALLANQL